MIRAQWAITPGLVTPNVAGQQQLSYTNYVGGRGDVFAGAGAVDTGGGRFEQNPRVICVLPVLRDITFLFGGGFDELARHDQHNQYEVVMVAPTFTDIPWYGAHVSEPRVQQERYMMEDIVPLVDNLYPRARAKRLLLGFSKGGLGAFTLLMRNPPVFRSAVAGDAPLMIDRFVGSLQMDEVYATEENFRRNFSLPGYSVYGRDTRDANELLLSYVTVRFQPS